MNKTRKIALLSVFSAIAIVLTFFEIPYVVTYLKFDFSELVVLITTSTVGLLGAVIVSIVKTISHLVKGGQSYLYIGEITALLAALTFAVTFYLTKKLNLIVRLVILCLVFTTVMVIFNFFIATPLFFQKIGYQELIDANISMPYYKDKLIEINSFKNYLIFTLVTYVPFNLLKSTLISIVYFAVHKPIIKAFKNFVSK